MRRCPVNLRVSPAALLVVESARISNAGQNQTVADARGGFLISRQPGDGPDRAGNEQKPIGITKIASGKKLGQKGRDRQSGKIVIRERRMAGMAGNQNLVAGPAGQIALAVGQVPVFESGVDAHFVFAVLRDASI